MKKELFTNMKENGMERHLLSVKNCLRFILEKPENRDKFRVSK